MDAVVITTAITNALFIKNSLQLLLEHKIENDKRNEIHSALRKVDAIHDTLFDTRNELSRLQVENQQLRQELKTLTA